MPEFDVFITEQAEKDLDKIIDFIRQQWPERIKTDFLAAVSKKMHLLTTMPYMYRASSTELSVRECIINSYITMYYRIAEERQRGAESLLNFLMAHCYVDQE